MYQTGSCVSAEKPKNNHAYNFEYNRRKSEESDQKYNFYHEKTPLNNNRHSNFNNESHEVQFNTTENIKRAIRKSYDSGHKFDQKKTKYES
jgi:hypothetical protein